MKYLPPYSAHIRTSILVLTVLILTAGCRTQGPQPDPNQVYFEIHPLYKTMIVPITINDTVTARMGFDTGGNFNMIEMDSSFCAAHPLHLWHRGSASAVYQGGGSAWVYQQPQGNMYVFDKDYTVTLGQTDVVYNQLTVWDQKGYFGENGNVGSFNMPVDTAHVWELNFEHNYIELHPTATFKAPEGCLDVPIQLGFRGKRVFAKIPMKITTSDSDTITINHDFLIDTGMGWDVAVVTPAEELAFFEEKAAIPFYFGAGGYVNRYIVDATILGSLPVDSLCIYTLKNRARLSSDYYIGLNFLKRFNVFFDLRNMRMYLQPLKEFRRAFSPLWKRFDMNISQTKSDTYIVTALGDHDLNPYKKAGIRVGDEIIGLNGVRLTPETSLEESKKLLKSSKVIIDILRDGKPLRLTMERDPNEIQGD